MLECDFPSREVAHNKRLEEVKEGNLLDGEQRRAAEEHEVWDGMLSTLSFFVGAAGDRPKAKKLLESGTKTMDRPEFIVRLGRTLLDNQKVFGRQHSTMSNCSGNSTKRRSNAQNCLRSF